MRISTKAAEAAKPGTKLTDDVVIPGGGALALVIKEKTVEARSELTRGARAELTHP